jgi:hypothetical protein
MNDTHTHTHTHVFAEIDPRWTVMLIGMIGATVITVTVGAMIIGGPVTTVTATVTTATATGTCVCMCVSVSVSVCVCACERESLYIRCCGRGGRPSSTSTLPQACIPPSHLYLYATCLLVRRAFVLPSWLCVCVCGSL